MGCTGSFRAGSAPNKGVKSALKFHTCCLRSFPCESCVLLAAAFVLLAEGNKITFSSKSCYCFTDLALPFTDMVITPGVTP